MKICRTAPRTPDPFPALQDRPACAASRPLLLHILAGALLLGVLVAEPATAYPEFEAWVERHSGRFVNCALCHTHPDGPEGVKPGQIRSLDRAALDRLNRARAAFEPGHEVDSPILNDFGDHIMEELGKRRFLEIRTTDPGELVDALGTESDLDGDGIPDATEYAEGTHPLDARHGAPGRLVAENLGRHWLDLLMIVLATASGVWGLGHLLSWAERRAAPETVERHPTGGGTIP